MTPTPRTAAWTAFEIIENAYTHTASSDAFIGMLHEHGYEIRPVAAPPDALRACPRCGLMWPHTATFRSPGEKEQHSWPTSPSAAPLDVERLTRALTLACGFCDGKGYVVFNEHLLTPQEGGPEPDMRECLSDLHSEFAPAAIAAAYSEEGA